nr:unnamed protein product [Digitaria exilis]
MSVTIELSSSFRHDSRPHDRTLEAPPSVALEAPQPSSRGALTLERRSVTLEAPQPSSRTYPRATFRHPRGSAAKLEGGTHPRARQARACGSSSKRRSAWSKCLVQARKLCPTPQTPTFNFTRFEVQFEFLEKIRIWKSELLGHATVPLARAALAGARPPRGAELAKPRRTLALPSLRHRRLASCRGAPSYGRALPWPHARSRRAERTAGGRVHSRSPLHHAMIFDAQPRVCALFELAAPSMATATATHALARSRGRTVPPLRAQALHRALPPLLSLAHLVISTSPRSPGLLLPRAVRIEPSFSEKFALHTPPFPNFPQIANSGHRSTRTSRPYSEPSPSFLEHAISFPKLCLCSRTSPPSANDPELAGVEAAAAAPPPPRRRHNSDLPQPPNRPQTTRGEPRIISPHFPVPSSPSQGPFFIAAGAGPASAIAVAARGRRRSEARQSAEAGGGRGLRLLLLRRRPWRARAVGIGRDGGAAFVARVRAHACLVAGVSEIWTSATWRERLAAQPLSPARFHSIVPSIHTAEADAPTHVVQNASFFFYDCFATALSAPGVVTLISLRTTHWTGLSSCALFLRQNHIAALYCSFRIFLVAARQSNFSISFLAALPIKLDLANTVINIPWCVQKAGLPFLILWNNIRYSSSSSADYWNS